MRKEILRGNRLKFSLVFIFLVAAALAMSACGAASYDEPSTTSATSALISAATLKDWVDEGLVNADSWDKVVILDYGSASDSELIPGACRVTTGELRAFRLEGVAVAAAMVATGAQMDAVIQRLGIDENTTIVFTTSKEHMTLGVDVKIKSYFPTRAYWTFRYWGFPKARLKVLDGGNAAWIAATHETDTTAPTVTASTYSVTDIGVLRDDLRASLGEMITMVGDVNVNGVTAFTVDARGGAAGSGYIGAAATTGMYDALAGIASDHKTVFEGHPTGGKFLEADDLFKLDSTYKSADAIELLFDAINWTRSKTVYAYCTSGYDASRIFFVLDALLDAPVQLYDGSFSQWGNMSDSAADDGKLTTGSNWATDTLTDTDGVPLPTYNIGDNFLVAADIEDLRIDTGALYLYPDPSSSLANQIENDDTEYIQGGTAAPGSGGGDSGGGC